MNVERQSIASGASAQEAIDAAPELPILPEVRSVGGVAHLALAAAIDPSTKLPSFYYAGGTVAPTIRVRPGDTIVIDYTNNLPVEMSPPLDITNLHTHGLMDSPKAPGDQVIMTMIMPGQSYRYVFNVPKYQPPGLYWYHPHPHGESNRQVASGMSGLIIIEGIETYAPIVRGLAERDIILRDYYFDPGSAPLSRYSRHAISHQVAREVAAQPTLDAAARKRSLEEHPESVTVSPDEFAPDCKAADASDGLTINGLKSATITMEPRSRQFFRIANSSANSFFDVKIPGTRFYVVAYDGVPLSFHQRSLQGQWVDHILIPPAGRAEAVVQAPDATGTPLLTGCVDTGPAGDIDPNRRMGTIALGSAPALHHADMNPLPPTAEPFGDINKWRVSARRLVTFTEDNPKSLFFINGRLWNPNSAPMYTVPEGTVEEWTVYNYARENHVFHIHQIHFAVAEINGLRQPTDTWRDTVTLPYAKRVNGNLQPGEVRLLMDFRDPSIVGTFVFHCHILEHEDYGMMAKIQVTGPQGAAVNSRGFHEGFLSSKLPAACKFQTKTSKLCGCDKAVQTVSFAPAQHR
jgi:suppressor of ftsI